MYKPAHKRRSKTALLAGAIACAVAIGALGCSGARATHTSQALAPSLEDAPLARRGGTNPNAPFAMLAPARQLARRPALIDPTLAEPCDAAQLGAYESGASVDGDRRTLRVTLVNHAETPCRLSGMPAVSLVSADGTPLAHVVVEGAPLIESAADSPAPAATVVLPARGESEFSIEWTTGEGCAPVASIAVAAPGTTRSYVVPHPLTVCGDRIVVSPVSGSGAL